MKKIVKVALILLAASFLSFGLKDKETVTLKKASYTIGTPYKVVDAPVKMYFHQDDELMTVKIRGSKITIQKLGTGDLEFKSENIYKEMPKGFVFEGIRELGKKYFLFYSVWDKPNKSEQLFCKEIDFSNGTLSDDEKQLIKTDGKITGTMTSNSAWGYSFSVTDKFDFFKSYDESKFMITYRKKPEEKKDDRSYDMIGMFVFDENLDEIWGDEVKMPYTEKKMNNTDYAVDKDGNAYVLAQVYNDNSTDAKKRNDENANYHMEVLRVPAGSKNVKAKDMDKTVIKIKDKFIQSIGFYEGPGDYMICAGYYNKGKNASGANGMFQFKIGVEGDLFDTKSYEFPAKLMSQNVSEREAKKNEKNAKKGKTGFTDMVLRNFIIGEDGSLTLIGEQYWLEIVTTYNSKGGSTTTYYYHYNFILAAKIGADGELAWIKKLPKRQLGVNRGRSGMSYKYIYDETNKRHYMVFLDHIKNLDLDINKPPYEHRDGAGGFLTSYSVDDESGDVSKVSILDTKNAKGKKVMQFNVDRVFKTGPGEFVFEAYKKKKQDILIKVNLKD